MTQEWIDWTGDNRIRTPLRGGGCNNYLNNNYTSNKMSAAAGLGLKTPSMMKSLQRPKGIPFLYERVNSCVQQTRRKTKEKNDGIQRHSLNGNNVQD